MLKHRGREKVDLLLDGKDFHLINEGREDLSLSNFVHLYDTAHGFQLGGSKIEMELRR